MHEDGMARTYTHPVPDPPQLLGLGKSSYDPLVLDQSCGEVLQQRLAVPSVPPQLPVLPPMPHGSPEARMK